jgi:ATP-dependent DNA helicase RecQ
VPAYVVCNDRTLHAIAAARPDSHAELEAVHGMGPNKVAQFGDAILEVLDACSPSATDKAGDATTDEHR